MNPSNAAHRDHLRRLPAEALAQHQLESLNDLLLRTLPNTSWRV